MSYTATFIQVADDCPVRSGVVPRAKGEAKSIALLQYELLSEHPYRYTHEDLVFEVHVRHKGVAVGGPDGACAETIRAELFAKSQPCLRASPLPKSYGWGIHYDGQGRIAVHAMESEAYARLSRGGDGGLTQLKAMRNRRA